MPHAPANTYTVPFNPLNNSVGEFESAKVVFNCHQFIHKRESRVTPYPVFTRVYTRLERYIASADAFNDLFLADLMDTNKR